jgi:hypothetical protein
MKFLIQTQPPYNLYQKFIWDIKNSFEIQRTMKMKKSYFPQREGHLGVWQLWMKNINVVWHIALPWHPLSVHF